MSDQAAPQMDPQQLMAMIGGQAPAGPPPTAPLPPPDLADVMGSVLRAADDCAKRCQMATDDRDVKDNAAAVLALAQAYITLDPTRLVGGDTPETRRAAIPATRDGDRDGKIGS